jgi:hypothetical protein
MPDSCPPKRNGVPGTNVACLYSALAEAPWIDIAANHLATRKYRVISEKSVTVEHLMNLPPCSVFGLDSHSNVIDADGRPIPCIFTATRYTDENIARYRSLIDADPPRLVKKYQTINKVKDAYLAITAAFITDYWKYTFADNGFVYFNCCHSGGEKTGGIRDAILNDGKASLFAAWSLRSLDLIGPQTATYLFTRMLGGKWDDLTYATGVAQEDPPQRPFRYFDLWEDMKRKNLGSTFDAASGQVSTLEFFEGEGDFGLLSPCIKYVETNEDKSTLTLHGYFGKRPEKDEKVTVDGMPVSISEWNNPGPYQDDTIVCKGLPFSGTGSEGDVMVTINGIESNRAPLTGWHGKFDFSVGKEGDKKSEKIISFTFPVFLRGDIHWLRAKPGEDPKPRPSGFHLVQDPANPLEISFGGSCEFGNKKYTWSGSGSVPPGGDPQGAFTVYGRYQMVAGMNPELMVIVSSGLIGKRTLEVDGKVIPPPNSPWPVTVGSTYDNVPELEVLKSEAEWDPRCKGGNFNIPGKTRTWMMDLTADHNPKIFKAVLTWEEMKARYPPDENTEQ